jgi:hypothetical protein
MDRESEYAEFAKQAERLSGQASSLGIAQSWRLIAHGFRRLADLHDAARQFWLEHTDFPVQPQENRRPDERH